jgi:hypothetical protein
MKCAAYAVQQAVYSAMKNDAALMAKVVDVFDDVIKGSAYPYITIGDMRSSWFGAHLQNGEEVVITITIWSQYQGYKEGLDIAGELQRLFGSNTTLSVTGYALEMSRFDSMLTARDPDGITRQIELEYRITVLEN